jgi:serine/threonine protein kinase
VQAPEVLMGDRCTEKVDMFSYGVILWELITGEAPARGRLRSVKCARTPALSCCTYS